MQYGIFRIKFKLTPSKKNKMNKFYNFHENSLSRLLDEQEISDLNFKNISTELNQKEQALAKLEESRNKLKNDLDRVDTELAEKRFHLSKYSTNNQLYQFRVTFILSSGTWSHCTTNHGTRSIL